MTAGTGEQRDRGFDHTEVEPKWQDAWDEHGVFHVPDDAEEPAYVLAIEYARVVGLDGCQSILEQRPDELKEVLEQITLEVQEVARMLGID